MNLTKPRVRIDPHFHPAKYVVTHSDGSTSAHDTLTDAIRSATSWVKRDQAIRNLMVDLGMIPGEARS